MTLAGIEGMLLCLVGRTELGGNLSSDPQVLKEALSSH